MVNWLKTIKQAYVNICLQKGYKDLLRQGKPIMVLLTEIYSWIKKNIRDLEVEKLTLEKLYKICEWYEKYENILRVFIHPKYAGKIEAAHIIVNVEPHEIDQLIQATSQQESQQSQVTAEKSIEKEHHKKERKRMKMTTIQRQTSCSCE